MPRDTPSASASLSSACSSPKEETQATSKTCAAIDFSGQFNS